VLQGAPELPAPRGYVNDFAGVISADDHDRIERIVQDVRAQSGGEIVIITLKDLGGRDIADIARQFGREWKVGKKGQPGDRARNTGVIILVVPKESSADGRGHVRIETGSGAEGFITDGDAGQIRDAAIPYFKQRDYGGGIALMTAQVAQRFAGEFGFALDSSLVPGSAFPSLPPAPPGYEYEPRIPGNNLLVALFVAFFIFIVILRIVGAVGSGCGCGCLPLMMGGGRSWMSSGGGWSSGGGGGGFGGFGGGGGFSGGGASGSW
jgi:uncharacterized protein